LMFVPEEQKPRRKLAVPCYQPQSLTLISVLIYITD
jgi:hypothetical protein